MTDPMLAKAAALEKELLVASDEFERRAQSADAPEYTVVDMLRRAALQLQQMRVRLEASADIEFANEVAAAMEDLDGNSPGRLACQARLVLALKRWRRAVGIDGDGWPIETEVSGDD